MMKLSALQVFDLFDKASDFRYNVSKLDCGGYELDVTVDYTTTYTGRTVPDNISLVFDAYGEVEKDEYNWFYNQLERAIEKKEEAQAKEARRKELLASMSKEDKELLGLN